MFSLNEAYTPITTDVILSKISEYNIWKYYCKNFEELGKSFISEFYNDTRPSCRIFITSTNNLLYKDFGTGECLSCWTYIQKKYNCNLAEAANIVANDFNIVKTNVKVEPKIIVANDNINLPKQVKKSLIEIVSQPWTIIDYNYWSQYKIPLELLDTYNVYSCKTVYLHKDDKTTVFNYNKHNPIYAYKFEHEGNYSYKIYFPLADRGYKWINNCDNSIIQGYNQLSNSKPIILTKSLKDVICYKLIGYNAIALQSEVSKLPKDFNVIVNYDNDEQGIKSTNKLVEEYGFDHFYIDDYKDLSDYIKNNGIEAAKKMIDGKIREEESIRASIEE